MKTRMKKVLAIAAAAVMIMSLAACGSGSSQGSAKPEEDTMTLEDTLNSFVTLGGYAMNIPEEFLENVQTYETQKAVMDVDGDGEDELLVKVYEPDPDYVSNIAFMAYKVAPGEVEQLFSAVANPNGEDGKLYYSEENKAVAYHTRGSDFHWTIYWDMVNKDEPLKSVGYQDDKETSQYVRHFYDCPGYFNYGAEDLFADNEQYEFASYDWNDQAAQEKAWDAMDEHIGVLEEITFEDVE